MDIARERRPTWRAYSQSQDLFGQDNTLLIPHFTMSAVWTVLPVCLGSDQVPYENRSLILTKSRMFVTKPRSLIYGGGAEDDPFELSVPLDEVTKIESYEEYHEFMKMIYSYLVVQRTNSEDGKVDTIKIFKTTQIKSWNLFIGRALPVFVSHNMLKSYSSDEPYSLIRKGRLLAPDALREFIYATRESLERLSATDFYFTHPHQETKKRAYADNPELYFLLYDEYPSDTARRAESSANKKKEDEERLVQILREKSEAVDTLTVNEEQIGMDADIFDFLAAELEWAVELVELYYTYHREKSDYEKPVVAAEADAASEPDKAMPEVMRVFLRGSKPFWRLWRYIRKMCTLSAKLIEFRREGYVSYTFLREEILVTLRIEAATSQFLLPLPQLQPFEIYLKKQCLDKPTFAAFLKARVDAPSVTGVWDAIGAVVTLRHALMAGSKLAVDNLPYNRETFEEYMQLTTRRANEIAQNGDKVDYRRDLYLEQKYNIFAILMHVFFHCLFECEEVLFVTDPDTASRKNHQFLFQVTDILFDLHGHMGSQLLRDMLAPWIEEFRYIDNAKTLNTFFETVVAKVPDMVLLGRCLDVFEHVNREDN